MAAKLRTPTNLRPCQPVMVNTKSFDTPKHLFIQQKRLKQQLLTNLSNVSSISMKNKSIWVPKFLSFAASGEATEINEVEETQTQENLYDEVLIEDSISDGIAYAEEKTSSAIMELLQSYREALASNDESKVAEIEVLLQSIEDEKKDLANKVVILSAELSLERELVLRISADFAFLRKRMEEVRLSLVTNVRGEVVESMRTVLDNFERVKSEIKVETEGEEKINNSYQSICKQFQEILGSLSIVPESTAGNPFDPMVQNRVDSKLSQLHKAIMPEESSKFEGGILIQEFHKRVKLGERLLRPSMIKVSVRPVPGPAKSEEANPIVVDAEGDSPR